MPESVYCAYCGREFLLREKATSASALYCSPECLEAAAKQNAAERRDQPERVLIAGRSPWGK
ncbi:hypothetical protein [Methanoculleus thermophilus]|uniref:Uncharacterized protein n=1 Tax=Methanoculleus thermophilus TaxID=2200 RepID=A0A1G8WYV8_9EURY|nr:hypothetical protein [Methanoculleus thermophilus]SDJ83394.1 hypothetical protein SAMN04488571_101165 [Methanoculleus thermophilus]